MSRIVVVENEFVTLEYLPDKKIVYHTIHKPICGQPLRDALNAGTETLIEYGACKWLSDDRKNGPFSKEDREWASTGWERRTIAAGWKYWALVVPQQTDDAWTLVAVVNALDKLGLRVMVFNDLENAFDWLDSMKG